MIHNSVVQDPGQVDVHRPFESPPGPRMDSAASTSMIDNSFGPVRIQTSQKRILPDD